MAQIKRKEIEVDVEKRKEIDVDVEKRKGGIDVDVEKRKGNRWASSMPKEVNSKWHK